MDSKRLPLPSRLRVLVVFCVCFPIYMLIAVFGRSWTAGVDAFKDALWEIRRDTRTGLMQMLLNWEDLAWFRRSRPPVRYRGVDR